MLQVFDNLIDNALEYSPPSEPLRIRGNGSHDGVVVEITDHGIGMAESTQQHIFEPFFTTHPVGSGQGLGLAISYGVVQQHGGSIEFESVLGKGTTFRVILPKAQRFL